MQFGKIPKLRFIRTISLVKLPYAPYPITLTRIVNNPSTDTADYITFLYFDFSLVEA